MVRRLQWYSATNAAICVQPDVDCDRILHLHRKARSHQRQVFKEEEEAIKVDLHEGCGRIKSCARKAKGQSGIGRKEKSQNV